MTATIADEVFTHRGVRIEIQGGAAQARIAAPSFDEEVAIADIEDVCRVLQGGDPEAARELLNARTEVRARIRAILVEAGAPESTVGNVNSMRL